MSNLDLLELNGIFGSVLEAALDIIDREKVTLCRCDVREYIEIAEHQNLVFKVLPNINFCMCSAFREQVLNTNEAYTCKHVLAARLAVLLRKVKVEVVKDDVLSFSLQMIQPMSIIPANE